MRKLSIFVGALALIGSLATWATTPAHAAALLAHKQIKWRTSAANAAGYVDSLTASQNGAVGTTGTVDTTVWISTADWKWDLSGSPATAYGIAKIRFHATGTPASTDSIFYAIETSTDGVTVGATNTTFVACVGTSGDADISGPLVADTDVVGSANGTGALWMTPYFRLRVRPDGNTGALMPGLELHLYYTREGPNPDPVP